jgi:membrane dipeptidase
MDTSVTSKLFLFVTTLLLATALGAQQSSQKASATKSAKIKKPVDAKTLHDSAIVIDTHADTTQVLLEDLNADFANAPNLDLTLSKAEAGNLGAEFFSVWIDPDLPKNEYAHKTLELIDAVYATAAKHPDRMVMAYSADDIVAARRGKKKRLAALMGIEGGHAIENSLHVLRNYYRLGVRYMTLTHSKTIDWADSSGDVDDKNVKHHNGLTAFGKEVVREMNRLGMLVDISHVSDKTFYETLRATRAPVIASHSSARAINSHARNMDDDMLRAITINGGVVMVNFYSGFIDEDFRKAWADQKPERDAAMAALRKKYTDQGKVAPYFEEHLLGREFAARLPKPKLKVLIDHIDHVAKTAGIDHVGLGSDFDGVSALPEGMQSAADLPNITAALLERGYSPADIKKILGGNFLRVFREAEAVAREMQKEAPVVIQLPDRLKGKE